MPRKRGKRRSKAPHTATPAAATQGRPATSCMTAAQTVRTANDPPASATSAYRESDECATLRPAEGTESAGGTRSAPAPVASQHAGSRPPLPSATGRARELQPASSADPSVPPSIPPDVAQRKIRSVPKLQVRPSSATTTPTDPGIADTHPVSATTATTGTAFATAAASVPAPGRKIRIVPKLRARISEAGDATTTTHPDAAPAGPAPLPPGRRVRVVPKLCSIPPEGVHAPPPPAGDGVAAPSVGGGGSGAEPETVREPIGDTPGAPLEPPPSRQELRARLRARRRGMSRARTGQAFRQAAAAAPPKKRCKKMAASMRSQGVAAALSGAGIDDPQLQRFVAEAANTGDLSGLLRMSELLQERLRETRQRSTVDVPPE